MGSRIHYTYIHTYTHTRTRIYIRSYIHCFTGKVYSHWSVKYLNTVILVHTGRVIYCNQNLVNPFGLFGPPQPYPVILKTTGYVWNYPPHVETFSRAVITSA